MLKKSNLLNLLATLFVSCTFAQDYLGQTKEEIITHFNSYVDSGYTVSFSKKIVTINTYTNTEDTLTHADTTANLVVSINGYEKIEMEYIFDEAAEVCDSIIIKYSCGKCIDTHINQLLSEKGRKWKQLDANRYISCSISDRNYFQDKETQETKKTVGSPFMQIKRTPDKFFCATVYFSIPMMEKEEWKKLTKK